MSDLISRTAAIAVADSSDYGGLSVEDVKKVTDEVVKGLKRLPSAQPEPQWTLCSERSPKGQTEVIVSCCDDSGDSKFSYTACGWMTRDGEYWIVDNDINYDVVAWMPFPEPYWG